MMVVFSISRQLFTSNHFMLAESFKSFTTQFKPSVIDYHTIKLEDESDELLIKENFPLLTRGKATPFVKMLGCCSWINDDGEKSSENCEILRKIMSTLGCFSRGFSFSRATTTSREGKQTLMCFYTFLSSFVLFLLLRPCDERHLHEVERWWMLECCEETIKSSERPYGND